MPVGDVDEVPVAESLGAPGAPNVDDALSGELLALVVRISVDDADAAVVKEPLGGWVDDSEAPGVIDGVGVAVQEIVADGDGVVDSEPVALAVAAPVGERVSAGIVLGDCVGAPEGVGDCVCAPEGVGDCVGVPDSVGVPDCDGDVVEIPDALGDCVCEPVGLIDDVSVVLIDGVGIAVELGVGVAAEDGVGEAEGVSVTDNVAVEDCEGDPVAVKLVDVVPLFDTVEVIDAVDVGVGVSVQLDVWVGESVGVCDGVCVGVDVGDGDHVGEPVLEGEVVCEGVGGMHETIVTLPAVPLLAAEPPTKVVVPP